MMRESKRMNGGEAILRDGSLPMLLPVVDIPRKKRILIAYNCSNQKISKQEKFCSLNILADAAELSVREKDQSFVKDDQLETELDQRDNAQKQKNSMANLLSCSYYGSWSPLDILADAAETIKMEENQLSLRIRSGLPFVPIPKKRRSSVRKPRVKLVQRMDLHGKRVTQKRHCNIEEQLESEKLQPLKKRRRMIMPKPELENVLPDFPVEFKNRIRELEGYDVKFLMQKQLYDTDISMNNNRLSMPHSQIHCEFLNTNEKAILNQREGDRRRPCGIEVMVLDPCLRMFNLSLKRWGMGSVSIYNLVKNWKRVVKENHLQSGDYMEIWSFRVHGNLYILLNCKR
ncbi:hypothetical protein L6164_028582 [Bauhinia variegata]|uniref:Uncharacterized protein n=1 Tax=Bauhinia variegata TaxID=167791 RepID=A0ACB9L629_BAUVA|nr:hypothetical protein L6164_028582 [Bauhinia variegata]